jgi:hypothetical protein
MPRGDAQPPLVLGIRCACIPVVCASAGEVSVARRRSKLQHIAAVDHGIAPKVLVKTFRYSHFAQAFSAARRRGRQTDDPAATIKT